MALDARAKFRITADGSDYKRKLKAAQRDTQAFSRSLRTALRGSALAGAAAVVATTIALARLTSNASKAADALAKQSDILGITTQKLAAYQLAARLSGSTNEGFEKGIRKLQKSIVDATDGLTTYKRAFDKLKLDPDELKQLTPDKQFEAVGKALAGVTNQTERVAIATDLFGSRNTALLNTLVLTGSNLNKLERDTKAWGVAITRVDAKQLENANDAAERASTAMQGIGTSIALAIAPLRGSLANAFADSAAEANGFRDIIQETMETLVVGANFAANTVRGIALSFLAVKLAALQLLATVNDLGAPSKTGKGQPPAAQHGVPTAAAQAQFRDLGLLKDPEERANSLRDAMDETGRAIDALTGKFQTNGKALTNFRNLQVEAAAAAAAEVKEMAETLTIELFVFDEDFMERERERQEQLTSMRQDTANRILAIEQKRVAAQESLEAKHQSVIASFRTRAIDTAIGLLRTLGSRSKSLAKAALVIEKALAVTRIVVQTNVAAVRAVAELGPIFGPPAAAKITAWGYGLAAATAAVGAAELGSLGSGSTAAAIEPANSRVFNNISSQSDQEFQGTKDTPQTVINVHFHGDVNGDTQIAKMLQETIGDIIDRDGVIIRGDSIQAMVIRDGF